MEIQEQHIVAPYCWLVHSSSAIVGLAEDECVATKSLVDVAIWIEFDVIDRVELVGDENPSCLRVSVNRLINVGSKVYLGTSRTHRRGNHLTRCHYQIGN